MAKAIDAPQTIKTFELPLDVQVFQGGSMRFLELNQ
jgi:hypothetical protein